MRRWLMVLVLLVLLGFGIYFLVSVLWAGRFVTGTVGRVVGNVVNVSGLSPWLVKGIAIIVTVPFFWAVAKYTKTCWGFTPLRADLNLYLNKYGIIIVLYVAAYFLTMYFASRGSYYTMKGESIKYCAETPEGIRVFDAPGVDPVYGIALRPCSEDQIRALRKELVGIHGPKLLTVKDPRAYEFFDGVSGRPKVWFYRSSDGHIDFYDKAGAHPGTGSPLSAINAAVIQETVALRDQQQREAQSAEVERQRRAQAAQAEGQKEAAARKAAEAAEQERAYRDQYINPGPANQPSRLDVALSTLSSPLPASLHQGLMDGLRARGAEPVDTLFRPAFASSGLAQALAAGNLKSVTRLRLAERVDAILIADFRVKIAPNPRFEGTSTANAVLDLSCLQVVQLRTCGTLSLTSAGTGFSTDAATLNAVEKLLPGLGETLGRLNL